MDKQGYLLLVEDDPMIQMNNKRLLERRGYLLRQAFSLDEARAIIAEEPPRAIVLDVMLPDGNGVEFLSELRKTSNVPVLMLTALGTRDDILRGLEAGGDNYLTKPYDRSVFLSHVEALLRRSETLPEMLVIGSIKLDPASGRAFVNGEDILLTQKEFSLLQQFAQYPNKLLMVEYLYEKVWGQEFMTDDASHVSLKNAISKLRKKISGSGYTITAEYGEGYMLAAE